MKKKVAELEGAELDYWVGKAEQLIQMRFAPHGVVEWRDRSGTWRRYAPSDRWDQGGPIIEREHISVFFDDERSDWSPPLLWRSWKEPDQATSHAGTQTYYGEKVLVATMRCHVASKFGDEVEI